MPSSLKRANAPPSLSRHAVDTARLAAPLAISQLSQMAMGVTDTILLGSLGPDSLAAGGLGANLFFVVVVLLQGVLIIFILLFLLLVVAVFAAIAQSTTK